MDPGGPSFGKVVLCCHLVGTVDLPGGSFSRSTLPSSFWGGGLFIPQFPLILHVALVGRQQLAEPEMWDELVVSGPGGWYLRGQARRRGKWLPGCCQSALSDLASVPSKVGPSTSNFGCQQELSFCSGVDFKKFWKLSKASSVSSFSASFHSYSSLMGLLFSLAGVPT